MLSFIIAYKRWLLRFGELHGHFVSRMESIPKYILQWEWKSASRCATDATVCEKKESLAFGTDSVGTATSSQSAVSPYELLGWLQHFL